MLEQTSESILNQDLLINSNVFSNYQQQHQQHQHQQERQNSEKMYCLDQDQDQDQQYYDMIDGDQFMSSSSRNRTRTSTSTSNPDIDFTLIEMNPDGVNNNNPTSSSNSSSSLNTSTNNNNNNNDPATTTSKISKRKHLDLDVLNTKYIKSMNNNLNSNLLTPVKQKSGELNDKFLIICSIRSLKRHQQQQQQQQKQHPDLIIESCSENIFNFLKFNQAELVGKSIYSYINPNDHFKFENMFNNNNKLIQKPFQCQLITNSTDTSATTKKYEPMIILPSCQQDDPLRIQFFIKPQDQHQYHQQQQQQQHQQQQQSKIISPSSHSKQSLTPNKQQQQQQQSTNINNNKATANQTSNGPLMSSIDCNMDQIKTKITLQGFIISVDSSSYKLFSNNNNNNNNNSSTTNNIKMNYSQAKTGLLIDYNNIATNTQPGTPLKLKLFDYVHSNDQNHIQKHISDVLAKGEITSAIYRLKVTDKYAFVQSHSKLINSNKNNNIDELKANNNDSSSVYIQSEHSIIKEIDSDVEMKGNASTSLMKTLISKRMPQSSSSTTSLLNGTGPTPATTTNKQNSSLTTQKTLNYENITNANKNDNSNDYLNMSSGYKLSPLLSMEELQISSSTSGDLNQKNQLISPVNSSATSSPSSLSSLSSNSALSSSINRSASPITNNNNHESPLSSLPPIGTKFALTMLGLTKSPSKTNLNKDKNMGKKSQIFTTDLNNDNNNNTDNLDLNQNATSSSSDYKNNNRSISLDESSEINSNYMETTTSSKSKQLNNSLNTKNLYRNNSLKMEDNLNKSNKKNDNFVFSERNPNSVILNNSKKIKLEANDYPLTTSRDSSSLVDFEHEEASIDNNDNDVDMPKTKNKIITKLRIKKNLNDQLNMRPAAVENNNPILNQLKMNEFNEENLYEDKSTSQLFDNTKDFHLKKNSILSASSSSSTTTTVINKPSGSIYSNAYNKQYSSSSSSRSQTNTQNQPSNQMLSNNNNNNNTKDDIILRALLNTSDLEPQVLQLESVFELNQINSSNNKNQPSKKDSKSKEKERKNELLSSYDDEMNDSSVIGSDDNEEFANKNDRLSPLIVKRNSTQSSKLKSGKLINQTNIRNNNNINNNNNNNNRGIERKKSNTRQSFLNSLLVRDNKHLVGELIKDEDNDQIMSSSPHEDNRITRTIDTSRKSLSNISDSIFNEDNVIKTQTPPTPPSISIDNNKNNKSLLKQLLQKQQINTKDDLNDLNHSDIDNNYKQLQQQQHQSITNNKNDLFSDTSASKDSEVFDMDISFDLAELDKFNSKLKSSSASKSSILDEQATSQDDEDMLNQLEQVFSIESNPTSQKFTSQKDQIMSYQQHSSLKHQQQQQLTLNKPKKEPDEMNKKLMHNNEPNINLENLIPNYSDKFQILDHQHQQPPPMTQSTQENMEQLMKKPDFNFQKLEKQNYGLMSPPIMAKTPSNNNYSNFLNQIDSLSDNNLVAKNTALIIKHEQANKNLDDELQKQKRIEAITKHLKSDLIESFKSLDNNINQRPANYDMNNNNQNSNFGSNLVSQKPLFALNYFDNNVPNLTIEPTKITSQTNYNHHLKPFANELTSSNEYDLLKQQQQNGPKQLQQQQAVCSPLSGMYPSIQQPQHQQLQPPPSASVLSPQIQPHQQHMSPYINPNSQSNQYQDSYSNNFSQQPNTSTCGSIGNDANNSALRKKLQERLQQRKAAASSLNLNTPNIHSNSNFGKSTPSNIAVVSPVISSVNSSTPMTQQQQQQQQQYGQNQVFTDPSANTAYLTNNQYQKYNPKGPFNETDHHPLHQSQAPPPPPPPSHHHHHHHHPHQQHRQNPLPPIGPNSSAQNYHPQNFNQTPTLKQQFSNNYNSFPTNPSPISVQHFSTSSQETQTTTTTTTIMPQPQQTTTTTTVTVTTQHYPPITPLNPHIPVAPTPQQIAPAVPTTPQLKKSISTSESPSKYFTPALNTQSSYPATSSSSSHKNNYLPTTPYSNGMSTTNSTSLDRDQYIYPPPPPPPLPQSQLQLPIQPQASNQKLNMDLIYNDVETTPFTNQNLVMNSDKVYQTSNIYSAQVANDLMTNQKNQTSYGLNDSSQAYQNKANKLFKSQNQSSDEQSYLMASTSSVDQNFNNLDLDDNDFDISLVANSDNLIDDINLNKQFGDSGLGDSIQQANWSTQSSSSMAIDSYSIDQDNLANILIPYNSNQYQLENCENLKYSNTNPSTTAANNSTNNNSILQHLLLD